MAAKTGPGPVGPLVDFLEIALRCAEELRECGAGSEGLEILHQRLVALADGSAHAGEDGVPRLLVELDGAAARQMREAGLDGALDLAAGAAEERAEAGVEAEASVREPDEVEHRDARLAARPAQPAAELLDEDRGALRGAEEEEGVDVGQVDAFVEEIDAEEGTDVAVAEPGEGSRPIGGGGALADGDAGEAGLGEPHGHELRVIDVDAEAEGPHRSRGGDVVAHRIEDATEPDVTRGIDAPQLLDGIAARCPGDLREVGAVADPEVLEGAEEILIERLPEAQLGSDAIAEPDEDAPPVGALRCGGEAEEDFGVQAPEDVLVGLRRGMVKLVDDDHVVGLGVEPGDARFIQGLHVGEDMGARDGRHAPPRRSPKSLSRSTAR